MEDYRTKHKTIQSAAHHIALECIHPQSAHGSPYHVHPYPSPVRLQHAFQAQQSPQMFHPKGLKPHIDPRAFVTPSDSPILGRALCLTPRGSPVPGRVSHLNEKFQDSLTLNSDTEALVAKISAMFPTVSETHIKILLKKYYNREAVVISALQVEKHPITTPGPLTISPSTTRLTKGALGVYSALQLAKGVSGSLHSANLFTPLTGTPQGSPLLLRPASCASSYYGTTKSDQAPRQHSPKMKLKYLKSVFPKAEETLILDVLANKDNNVQKASEELISMGFTKKETVIIPQKKKEKDTPQPPKKVVTIMKTLDEKNELKQKLQNKYNNKVAERVISIALESVDYNEDRAEQILAAVVQEEETPKVVQTTEIKDMRRPNNVDVIKDMANLGITSPISSSPSPQPMQSPAPPRRLKTWTDHLKPIVKSSINVETKYKSHYSISTSGPNPSLRQGPKDSLLLEDYMTWNGPNPELRCGPGIKQEGPENKSKSMSLARGSSGIAKGPAGLAKGSIYQNLTKKSAKIYISVKQKLQNKYNNKVAERVISIALESVDYNEDRAEQILAAVVQEEETPKVVQTTEIKDMRRPNNVDVIKDMANLGITSPISSSPSPQPMQSPAPPRRLKTWTDHLKPIVKSSINVETKYKSHYSISTSGPNPSLRQGPKDSLLLEDYMTWNGPNPELRCGPGIKQEGPENKSKSMSLARGSSGIAKGPAGLAKGSIYQNLTKKSAKIIV